MRGSDQYRENSDGHRRDHYREKYWRNDRERYRSDEYDRDNRRDHRGRLQDDYKYRDRRQSHRPRSRSNDRSRNKSTSHSQSPSKSKRTSGFDMGPLGDSLLAVDPTTGEIPSIGTLPAIFPLVNPQISFMPTQSMTQQATRHARRVYVGGLPPLANEQTIATFFSHVMTAIGGNSSGPGDAVVNVYINHEKKFAFVEMRSVEEASNAMALDGIIFEGVSVRVRRPTDYNSSSAAALGPCQPSPHLNLAAVGLTRGIIGGGQAPDHIFVGGLPYYFTDTQIRELLEAFGPLRGFDLVKDRDTGNSKGYGFCLYEDPSVTDVACAALNGLKMGDKTLTMRRATASTMQMKSEQELILQQAQQHIAMQKMAFQLGGGQAISGAQLAPTGPEISQSKVVCLTEAVSASELMDDDEYREILEDMKEECQKFGPLIKVIIPRPNHTGEVTSGIGKVYLEYADTISAAEARDALNGRKFGGKSVTASLYPEDEFMAGNLQRTGVA